MIILVFILSKKVNDNFCTVPFAYYIWNITKHNLCCTLCEHLIRRDQFCMVHLARLLTLAVDLK